MKNNYLLLLLIVILSGCGSKPQPKPYSYFRIDIPEHGYETIKLPGQYSFEINKLCHPDSSENFLAPDADHWINLFYPSLNATIHLSYKKINKNEFQQISEECRSLAYKHSIRADAITESYYANNEDKVFGVFYEMKGNAASPAQFFVTDSTNNFLRGSLYFNHVPNADSIAPASYYIQQDMIHLIETLNWK